VIPGDGSSGLASYARSNHGPWRGRRQVLGTVATALVAGAAALHPTVREVTRVGPVDVLLAFGAFLCVSLGAAWAHRRLGFGSRTYQSLNSLETATTVFGSLFLVFRSGGALSLFWVFYFAVVGQAASFGANIGSNTALISIGPAVLACAFALAGDGVSAVLTCVTAGVAVAGYRMTLGSTRHTAQAAEDRQRLAQQERELSVLRERERIGRDLHDGLGAELAALVYRVQELELPLAGRDELASRLHDVLEDLRSVVWLLRRERLSFGELLAWVRTRCRELGAGQVRVAFEVDGEEDLALPGELGTHVVRVVLESVRNAVRHSGTQEVTVALKMRGGVEGRVSDRGRGLPTGAGARSTGGLANLRARALALGGTLEVETSHQGTVVQFACPLPPRDVEG
jgi:signal transduction histidine kinase